MKVDRKTGATLAQTERVQLYRKCPSVLCRRGIRPVVIGHGPMNNFTTCTECNGEGYVPIPPSAPSEAERLAELTAEIEAAGLSWSWGIYLVPDNLVGDPKREYGAWIQSGRVPTSKAFTGHGETERAALETALAAARAAQGETT